MNSFDRYNAEELIRYASTRLEEVGLGAVRSRVIAETLVEGDLMGHNTHGIKLLIPYIEQLQEGKMRTIGEPEVIYDSGSTLTWDGQYLPGPWLVHEAIDEALSRIQEQPVMTLTISKSHHIGCLAAYPQRATREGLMMLLACSDPRNRSVAPFGGVHGAYSPNPIAGGIPTNGDPVIFDLSSSETAVGRVMEARDKGIKLPYPWLHDPKGNTTNDPVTFFKDPPSTILPLGGPDTGHKGFALGLLVEALTNGLSGHGRKDEPDRWGASVFLQIIDPDAFGGKKSMLEEISCLAERCYNSPSIEEQKVRLPGSRALNLKDEQMKNGVKIEKRVSEEIRNQLSGQFPQPLN